MALVAGDVSGNLPGLVESLSEPVTRGSNHLWDGPARALGHWPGNSLTVGIRSATRRSPSFYATWTTACRAAARPKRERHPDRDARFRPINLEGKSPAVATFPGNNVSIDMTYDEDCSHVRRERRPHAMATVRNVAISLLRLVHLQTPFAANDVAVTPVMRENGIRTHVLRYRFATSTTSHPLPRR